MKAAITGAASAAPEVKYLRAVPRRRVPAGRVVVHNHVTPTARLGDNGFRAWLTAPRDGLEPCPCDWAPELGGHFRVAAVWARIATRAD